MNDQERQRLRVTGAVQGVGFRPFVYDLATRLGLAGFVSNDSHGVMIEVEGVPAPLATFAEQLLHHPPPLAQIEEIATTILPVVGTSGFVIAPSAQVAGQHTLIAPDVGLCADCLCELFDPQDRRYRYPFINCTNCGPRFTIIYDLPYDRPLTTMAAFPLCPACQAEYDDPRNRRFHAQPNACPVCGPQVEWRMAGGEGRVARGGWRPSPLTPRTDPIQTAQEFLRAGAIVAVKGIGGFHLACDAGNDQAVATLRQRKGRGDKPFALLVADLATAQRIAHINAAEAALLTSRARPIVLLRKRADAPVSPLVAPGNPCLGIMLPYSPLHYLLLAQDGEKERQGDKATPALSAAEGRRQGDETTLPYRTSPRQAGWSGWDPPLAPHPSPPILVMTSANYSDEPIIKDNDEALVQLAEVADGFLLHNRAIHMQCDDSVLRVFEEQEMPLRRSRGYAPLPVRLPFALDPVLAVGGELKATFCLTSADHALLSQHIGDMANLTTLQAFERTVQHFQHIFRVEPVRIACDLHPGYLSTRWAETHANGRPVVRVQHHHAHIAALMAEHGLSGQQPVIGFCFDGTGYGTDGAIWGGEVLIADYHGFQRAAHLQYIPLPGGDAAIKRPYRTALAHLWAAGIEWDERLPPVAICPPTERKVIQRQLATNLNSAPTSSLGRLFDAVAALAGGRQTSTYEGQAAIELEALVALTAPPDEAYTFAWTETVGQPLVFDAAPVIRAVAADVLAGCPGPLIATRFHQAVANLVVDLSHHLRRQTGIDCIGLTGGVFQNMTLLKLVVDRLRSADFTVLIHQRVPPNDGGLALGQAMVAG